VDGAGTPAAGPYDILVENNRITQMVALDPVSLGRGARRIPADAEIDAKGKYVLPGLINAHEASYRFCNSMFVFGSGSIPSTPSVLLLIFPS
jgi:predicted amidohydrolase YtcJ